VCDVFGDVCMFIGHCLEMAVRPRFGLAAFSNYVTT
jgi:hypothetical protein